MSILEVHDVSIRYLTGDFKEIGIKEYVMRKLTHNYHVSEFWADRHVSFTLEKGEMLGIIGSNGAGKSTLLKVVAGIMEPTEGWVTRQGNVAALLELGSGFDGDLTVRENAYLRGAMLGYTRSFMDETYDDIIAFAELEEFQDRPFKQLSSGMKSRLAFAIASLVEPDILILDEVLSVGDGAFRKKSEEKMKEIISGGAATILVSHSLDQVEEMCTKVLWLEKGEQIACGDTDTICSFYQQYLDKTITLEEAKKKLNGSSCRCDKPILDGGGPKDGGGPDCGPNMILDRKVPHCDEENDRSRYRAKGKQSVVFEEQVSRKKAGEKWNNGILYVFLIALIAVATHRFSIAQIRPELDPSYVYFYNIAGSMGLKVGRDVILGYGPLGFLRITNNIGHNVAISMTVNAALMLTEIWLLWCTFRRLKKAPGGGYVALLFTAVMVIIAPQMSTDYVICFLVVLSVSLAWYEEKTARYLTAACVLTVLSALIKFNTGIQCVITLTLFAIGKLIMEKRKAWKYVLCLPIIVTAFTAAYLIYDPSVTTLIQYVKGSLEITSGYSAAMSIYPETRMLLFAVICGVSYCAVLLLVLLRDVNSGVYMLLFSGALFQVFKHGYVRADAHVNWFFLGFAMICAVVMVFLDHSIFQTKTHKERMFTTVSAVLAAVMLLIPVYVFNPSPQGIKNQLKTKLRAPVEIKTVLDNPIQASDKDVLPDEILNVIGQEEVAVLPTELSIDAYNDINMVVMPSIQVYMIHTAGLDEGNAVFFQKASAPKYIIFSFLAIDGRLPLLEMPATWRAIYENYNAVLQAGQYLLLEKKDVAEPIELGAARTAAYPKSEQITLPKTENGTYVSVESELSLWGKLNKFFFQIPPVTVTLDYDDGTQVSGRVLPELLENGIILDDLPNSLLSTGMVLNGTGSGSRIVAFRFGGEGWDYYKDEITVTFQEVQSGRQVYTGFRCGGEMQKVTEDPTRGRSEAAVPRAYSVDRLNNQRGVPESLEMASGGKLQIHGWALDDVLGGYADDVYFKLGNDYFTCDQTSREDASQAILGNAAYPMCGFDGMIPLDGYSKGGYPLSIVIICKNGTEYYEAHISDIMIS